MLENTPFPINDSDPIDTALALWRQLLGSDRVLESPADLLPYAQDCSTQNFTPQSALLVSSLDEVRRVLQIADSCAVPVYPISRGTNWGYGSATPSAPHCHIIDLKGMNRILDYDKDLGLVVIEPGVTQKQLSDFLKAQGEEHILDVTGASPSSSVLGNILERGFGLGPYSDHYQCSAGFEVVLANGEILNPGLGRFKNSKITHLFKWGIGPFMEGLFTQSNFGVVTKAGVWLMPRPKTTGMISFSLESDEEFCRTIERLRKLRQHGLLKGALHVANDLRLLSSFYRTAASESSEQLVSEESIARMRKQFGIGAWNAVGGVWGDPGVVKAEVAAIRAELRGTPIKFMKESTLEWLKRAPRFISKLLQVNPSSLDNIMDLLRGVPSDAPLRMPYGKKRGPVPLKDLNPARDRCGLKWLAPMVPMTSNSLSCFIQCTRRACRDFGFDTNVTVTLSNERVLCCTVAILYAMENPELEQRSEELYRALLSAYMDNGFIPYRAGSNSFSLNELIAPKESAYGRSVAAIKKIFDPHGILSPGRYGID